MGRTMSSHPNAVYLCASKGSIICLPFAICHLPMANGQSSMASYSQRNKLAVHMPAMVSTSEAKRWLKAQSKAVAQR